MASHSFDRLTEATERRADTAASLSLPYPHRATRRPFGLLSIILLLSLLFDTPTPGALAASPPQITTSSPPLNHRLQRHLSLPSQPSQAAHYTSDAFVNPDTSENEGEDQHSGSTLCDPDGIIALGMESGQIPDSALTASSAYEMLHVGPNNARLKTDNAGGAWCPQKQLNASTSGSEWIQVDLGSPHVITGIATQGRFGKGMGQEFTEAYRILYSRQSAPSKWVLWKSWDNRSNLEGNIDSNTVEEHHLEWPIVGVRQLRLVPLSNYTRTVCLRFELYGCSYHGPISYSSPVPSGSNVDPRLLDNSYDGSRQPALQSGGLGKLIDGVKPLPDNMAVAASNDEQSRDSVWLGWPPANGSRSTSLDLIFEFDRVQNFTTVAINCLNSYSHHVRVFSVATVWFSLDQQHWSESPIRFEYQADNVIELPRDVIVHLQYRIGRFVRIELTYHSEWLHISEVTFDCRPLEGNWSNAQVEALFGQLNSPQYNLASDDATAGGTRYIMPEDKAGKAAIFPAPHGASNQNMKYSLIVICLCTLGLVIISLLTSLTLKKLNNRKNNVFREISDTDLESEAATINLKNLPKDASPLYCEPKEIASMAEEAEYAIPDIICPSNLSKTLNFHKPAPNAIACKTLQINPRFYASSDIICPKQNIYGTRPGSQILNVFDIGSNLRTLNPSQQYHQKQLSQQQQAPLLDSFGGCKPASALLHNQRASFYGDNGNGTSFGMRVYSEAEIGVLQSLGKSKFGDVLLCNLPAAGKNRLAVVRTVNDLNLKAEFTSSMQFARQLSLNCDKFARLFGVIETPTYFASITEHADCDLYYFLRKSSPDFLSYETLLYIASEIASAGAYLESSKQTHRDIATRNVIVYEKNLTVKLTDVALYVDKYAFDYYNGLPIRWMSPESVVRTEFSVASDVYAFGVTFWEILTLCQCRPFAEYSDEELISAVYAHMDDGEDLPRLPRPTHSSAEIYELLEECVNSNENQRPSFKEICLFLQRKTLGFAKPPLGTVLSH